jgi:predicted extracellular nuclease
MKHHLPVLSMVLFYFLLSGIPAHGQGKAEVNRSERNPGELRFMFYNVENLFDTENDTLTNDDEFLPEGSMHWTNGRLNDKLNRIFKVIAAAGGWTPPEIIGISEVENSLLIERLTRRSPLAKFSYDYVHRESRDERGIDVALLYRTDRVRVIATDFFPALGRVNEFRATRDNLHAVLWIDGLDTLDIIIVHWPSRYAGLPETKAVRMQASHTLRQYIDSLGQIRSERKIIVAGDFNDGPTDESVLGLCSLGRQDGKATISLVNVTETPAGSMVGGSHKFQGQWYLFDQILVSLALLEESEDQLVARGKAWIFCPDFLLVPDEQYLGVKPFRTYNGYNYEGGYSDHLPVLLVLSRK